MSTPRPEPAITKSRSKATAAVLGAEAINDDEEPRPTTKDGRKHDAVLEPWEPEPTQPGVQMNVRMPLDLYNRIQAYSKSSGESITSIMKRGAKFVLDSVGAPQ